MKDMSHHLSIKDMRHLTLNIQKVDLAFLQKAPDFHCSREPMASDDFAAFLDASLGVLRRTLLEATKKPDMT